MKSNLYIWDIIVYERNEYWRSIFSYNRVW